MKRPTRPTGAPVCLLCQNKHFSTEGRKSPNSKRKAFSCFLSIFFSTINLVYPNKF